MSNPSDRSRDRSSFQDLAKLAGTPSMTPAPPAVSSGVSRGEEASKDDSGIVDLKAIAAADPAAEKRAESTPLATSGLFDDDKAGASGGVPAVAAAATASPLTSETPPPSATLASPSTAAPEPVAAVASPAKKDEKKKGNGLFLILGGVGALAAMAAGGFFYMKSHKAAPQTVVAANTAPVVANKPAAVVTSTAPTPTDSVAIADTNAPPDVADNTPDRKGMPKFTGTKSGVAAKPGASAAPGAPTSSADPSLVFNMPSTNAGTGTSDLDEEMRQRVGGKKELTPAATNQAGPGNVPQKPSQGQVAGAVNVVLPAARACLSSDDPISKATVVFQSDGTVQSVTVTGFAAGKSSEGCVKAALTKAKVPAFAEPSYSFPVTIRGTN